LASAGLATPAGASSLALASTLKAQVSAGVSVDGAVVIPFPDFDASYPPEMPATPGVTSGSMNLGVVGPPAAFDFTLTLLSDAHPYVATGVFAGSNVTLEVDQLEFDSTGSQVFAGPAYFLSISGTATVRGSLTVGASVLPFSFTSPTQWSGDGAAPGTLVGTVTPGRVVVGFQYGEIVSGAGGAGGIVTAPDGTQFNVGAGLPFWSLTYVPEPSSFALAFLGLVSFAATRTTRAGKVGRL